MHKDASSFPFSKVKRDGKEIILSAPEEYLSSLFPGHRGAPGDCFFPAHIELGQAKLGQKFSKFRVRAGLGQATTLCFSKILFVGRTEHDVELVDVSSHAVCSQSSEHQGAPNGKAGAVGPVFGNNVHTEKEQDPWWQAEFSANVDVRQLYFYRRCDWFISSDEHIRITGVDAAGVEVVLYDPQNFRANRADIADMFEDAVEACERLSAGLQGAEKNEIDQLVATGLGTVAAAIKPDQVRITAGLPDLSQAGVTAAADALLDAACLALGSAKDFGFDASNALDIALPDVEARYVRFRVYGDLPPGLGGAEIFTKGAEEHAVLLGKEELKFRFRATPFVEPKSYSIGLTTRIHSRRHDLGSLQVINRLRVWNLNSQHAANTLFLEISVRSDERQPWQVVYDHGAAYRDSHKILRLVNFLIDSAWTPAYTRLLGKLFTLYRRRALMGPVARLVRNDDALNKAVFLGSNEIPPHTRFAAPLKLGKHGLSVPIAFRDEKMIMAHLVEMRDKIRAAGHKPMFMYGTLLGAIREKDFIPHDDDVDLAVILEGVGPEELNGECERFIAMLNDIGVKAQRGAQHAPLIHCHRGSITYDIFLLGHVGDTVYWPHTALKLVPERADIFLPVGTVEFKGEIFDAPRDPEAVSEARYGSDWRVPNPAFEW